MEFAWLSGTPVPLSNLIYGHDDVAKENLLTRVMYSGENIFGVYLRDRGQIENWDAHARW